jgi:hypothetical protein
MASASPRPRSISGVAVGLGQELAHRAVGLALDLGGLLSPSARYFLAMRSRSARMRL